MGNQLKLQNKIEPEYVFCSDLLRTIQTAILMFPKHFFEGKIKIIRGVAEIGFTGNRPDTKEETLNILKKWLNYINYYFNEDIPFKIQDQEGTIIRDDQYTNRFKELKEKNQTKLLENLYENYDKTQPNIIKDTEIIKKIRKLYGDENIAIVSHENYINKYVAKSIPKLKNNQLLIKKYKINDYDNYIKEDYSDLYNNGCSLTNNEYNCNINNESMSLDIKYKKRKECDKTFFEKEINRQTENIKFGGGFKKSKRNLKTKYKNRKRTKKN